MLLAPTRLALCAICVLAAQGALAQGAPGALAEQRGGTFVEPPARIDPVYLPAGPDGRRADPDEPRHGLSLRIAVDQPLSRTSQASGRGTQGAPPGSPTLQAGLRWDRPGMPWFGQVNFFRYLDARRQQPWNPDFSYSFGYDDPGPGTFSLVYSNFAGNRIQADRGRGERPFNFSRGVWTLGYKFGLPPLLEPLLLAGDGDSAACSANLNHTSRYTDVAGGPDRRGKQSLSVGCRWSHPQGWFAHFTAFGYPQSGKQQPWDPDFTYSVGLAGGPIAPFTVQYANYSGNRWPGRDRGRGQGSWRNGSVSVSWVSAW